MRKTERFGLLLDKDEMEILTVLAKVEGGLSRAALIRQLIRKKAMEYGYSPMDHHRGKVVSQINLTDNHHQKEATT